MIENWPDAPKMGARQMMEQYGLPNEATPSGSGVRPSLRRAQSSRRRRR
ncbi:MAG: hypothetical protein M3220_16840 [Chloroflexota bacterium]|nr:hypothetical protein [Chloroflexota bacterium]